MPEGEPSRNWTRKRTRRPTTRLKGNSPSGPQTGYFNFAPTDAARIRHLGHLPRGRAAHRRHRTPASDPRRRCRVGPVHRRQGLSGDPKRRSLARQGALRGVGQGSLQSRPKGTTGLGQRPSRRSRVERGCLDRLLPTLRNHTSASETAGECADHIDKSRARFAYLSARARGPCVGPPWLWAATRMSPTRIKTHVTSNYK